MHIISGIHKNRVLQSPKGLKTRPTSGRLRESLFNICQNYIEDCSFLDLFAGSGAIGLEAISRGAKMATFVDNSKESIRCIHANIKTVREEQRSQVLYGNVIDVMGKLSKQGCSYDIIFADPPYGLEAIENEHHCLSYSEQVLNFLSRMIEDKRSLLKREGLLFLEDAQGVLENLNTPDGLLLKSTRQAGHSALYCYTMDKIRDHQTPS